MSRHTPRVSTGLSRPLISAGRCLLAQRPDGPSSGGAVLRGTVYWERVVPPQVRAHMMCAAGKALCDASQLALPTSDSLARQGGDSDRTRAAPHRPPLAVTCRRKALCGTAAVGAPRFGCSSAFSRASSHDTLGLSGELEREDTHNTAPSSCSRASLAGSCAVPGTVCVVLPLINQPQA